MVKTGGQLGVSVGVGGKKTYLSVPGYIFWEEGMGDAVKKSTLEDNEHDAQRNVAPGMNAAITCAWDLGNLV